ncbi:MAG: hypothetical protein F4048_11475 [Gammaproteobacteria bacterium]|nr:hypothetical protein [Gammaproteobacteria bacterium]
MVLAQEERERELSQRFLRTAVVVDDKAEMTSESVPEKVVAPDRRTRASSKGEPDSAARGSQHTLDARSVIGSFSKLGMICGVVGPEQSAMAAMRQADIVVLDWLLQDGDSRYTLKLLGDLLGGKDDRNALRLVVVYTGEARLDDIAEKVLGELQRMNLNPQESDLPKSIPYRHGRVVLYAKSNVNLAEPLKERSVAAEDLPSKLLDDFTDMTAGLLPSIALTSLAAVRESEHKVLDQFRAELDPAFLAHRACLAEPEEAEGQMVSHVAEELRGLMDNAVADTSPTGAGAVEKWLRGKFQNDARVPFGEKELSLEQTVKLANGGLKSSDLKEKSFKSLSGGFNGSEAKDLDERLAWIMSFRTVFNAPPPTLSLGTVVSWKSDIEEQFLLCLRPRCDCVRLTAETTFLFLPLSEPQKRSQQIVVRLGNEFKRLAIGQNPEGWVLRQFCPSGRAGSVTATQSDVGGSFLFTDTCGLQYTWQGELKAEYAQRIVQAFSESMSRVAVDESEWLRRMAKN